VTRVIAAVMLAFVAATVPSLRAGADTLLPPYASRVVLGLTTSQSLGDLSRGTPRGGEVGGTLGFALSYEHSMRDRLSLSGDASFSTWERGAAIDAGYDYQRIDLGLAPHLRILSARARTVSFGLDAWVALPVGLSRPFGSAPPRRAFYERIDGRWGWYAGAVAGAVVRSHRSGVLLEIGYTRHAADTSSVITPHDPAIAPVVDTGHQVDHEIRYMLGTLFCF
jgi:hypothetical protein